MNEYLSKSTIDNCVTHPTPHLLILKSSLTYPRNTHSIMFAMRLEKYPGPLQFGFGSRLNAREIEKMQNYPPTKLGTTLSPFLFKSWHKDVKICCIAQDIFGTRHCGVFQPPWRARRSFFYSEVRMAVFHLPLLVPG